MSPANATSDCFVSIIAPLQDDADIIDALVSDVIAIVSANYENYELVLVDDGSTDDTVQRVTNRLASERCIRLIRLSRKFGKDIAISAGLDTVIGDFVVVLTPESDPPEMIPAMVERCRQGAGIVYGIRSQRPKAPWFQMVGARAFYWYFNRILGVHLPANSTDYRAYSRQAVNAIIRIKDHLRYLRTFGTYVGYGAEPFVYEPRLRRKRPRARSAGEAIGLALNMTVANSVRPLRVVSLLGVATSLLSALYAGFVLFLRATNPNLAEGWATHQFLLASVSVFLFLILATLCEYVGRLLGEVRDRPLYFVAEERNSSVLLAGEDRENVVTRPD